MVKKSVILWLFVLSVMILSFGMVSATTCTSDADCGSDAACYVSGGYCVVCADGDGNDPYTQDTNVYGIGDLIGDGSLYLYDLSSAPCYSSDTAKEYTCVSDTGDDDASHTFLFLEYVTCDSGVCSDGACTVSTGEGASCTENTDCDSGLVCDTSVDTPVCTAYCGIGEAECSDGIDNDGDGTADYAGACYEDSNSNLVLDPDEESSLSPCSYETSTGVGIANCDACNDEDIGADSDCVSPLDPYEGTGVGTTYAPEAEQGFFARLWNFLIFWN